MVSLSPDKFFPFLWFLQLNIRLQMTSMDKHCQSDSLNPLLFSLNITQMNVKPMSSCFSRAAWAFRLADDVLVLRRGKKMLNSGRQGSDTWTFPFDQIDIKQINIMRHPSREKSALVWFITFWKPSHLFHPFQQLNYSLGDGGKNHTKEQGINHFDAIKKIGCFFSWWKL